MQAEAGRDEKRRLAGYSKEALVEFLDRFALPAAFLLSRKEAHKILTLLDKNYRVLRASKALDSTHERLIRARMLQQSRLSAKRRVALNREIIALVGRAKAARRVLDNVVSTEMEGADE